MYGKSETGRKPQRPGKKVRVLEIRWSGQASGRRGHVGKGLDEVRSRCVVVSGRVFQAKGKGRLRRRLCGQSREEGDIMVDRLAWLDHKASEATGLSLCRKQESKRM